MSLEIFTQARAGLEATPGTGVTPTRILHGTTFTHEQITSTIRPEEKRNNYEGFWSAAAGIETNTFGHQGLMDFDAATYHFNQFIAPLGTASGTAGAAYTYTFTPLGTADNVKRSSVQLGYADTIATAPGVSLVGVVGNTMTLHWGIKNEEDALSFENTYMTAGTATQITAFTGSPTDPATTYTSLLKTSVTIDAATIGTTADTNVVSIDWTLNLNPVPFYTLDGTAGVKTVYRPNVRTWEATIRRQYANDAEWDVYQSKAERKIRILSLGPALGGTFYTVQLDLYGVYTGRSWNNVNGIITEDLTFAPIVDTGAGTISFQGVVVTNLGTLV